MILRSARPAATFKDGLIRHSVGEIHGDYVGLWVLELPLILFGSAPGQIPNDD